MIAVVCLTIVVLLLWKKLRSGGRLEPPLADRAYPVIGHSWLGFIERHRIYDVYLNTVLKPSIWRNDDLIYLQLGLWKLYVCMDPEDGYMVMNSCLKKDYIYKFFSPVFGGEDGLITSYASTWKLHRKLLNPTMNQSVLDTYLTDFNSESRELVEMFNLEVGQGPFDPLQYVKKTMFQIICATLMGVNIKEKTDIVEKAGEEAAIITSCVVERYRKFYYHNDFLFNLSNLKKKQDAAIFGLHSLTRNAITVRREKMFEQHIKDTDGPRFNTLVDHLIKICEQGSLTESEIHQELNTFFSAGFDTTFHTLGMVLLIIGSYPAVQRNITDELESVFEGSTRDVEKQDLSKLKYLEATIKETMRLYPVVVNIGRYVDKDLKLKKYTLPAGSRCFVSIYHVSRHRSWGADAEQFRPERWMDGSLPRHVGAFAAFGMGRRSCIGSHFAMMVMKIVLCHLIRAFRISGDVSQAVLNYDIVVSPASGHHITVQRRNK